jgi:hypothetical protein
MMDLDLCYLGKALKIALRLLDELSANEINILPFVLSLPKDLIRVFLILDSIFRRTRMRR